MQWLKAFHVIFMVTWFAGLFYLPRLFVYHADAQDDASLQRFIVMERRLLILMTIGGGLTALFGMIQLVNYPPFVSLTWMQIKLALVAALVAYHVWCWELVRAFAAGRNRHTARWYRWFNEVPSVALIAIVLLAVVKQPV